MDEQTGTLLRSVLDAAPDAVLVVDADGRIALANAQCREVFGHLPDDLVGRSVEVLVPARFRDRHPARRGGFTADPDPRPMGLLRLAAERADGTEFAAEISLAPVTIAGAAYVSATVRDLTGRILAEERFRSLLEAAPDPTVIIDGDASIVLANNRVRDVLGYEPTDLVGQPLPVIVSQPGEPELLERFEAYLAAPEAVPMGYTQEFRARHRDGHDLPIEVSLSPVETADGVMVSIAIRDMSERLALEAEAQRVRDELIATVSHELRTPLTSIIGYAELMRDLDEADLSRRARKQLAIIERNAARELQLVDDLLTMAFIEGNRLRILRTPVDLGEVAARVVGDHALAARERGLQLVFERRTVPLVLGDFYRLVQVLENLVTNAVKFTDPGGRVEVRIGEQDSMGILEVHDTGVGVPAEERTRLFERLYRGPAAVAAHTQGAGLGLSIVEAIVEAHGGWVALESEVGVGTVVRVAIPFA
ncbi:PAS domain S-box protein [Nocardioides caricicola]|uniref:histidine kinase n=1 Tax=Nocardioides caricicola TaxID=634770 RepID=A0ABW0N5H2_9ACTN